MCLQDKGFNGWRMRDFDEHPLTKEELTQFSNKLSRSTGSLLQRVKEHDLKVAADKSKLRMVGASVFVGACAYLLKDQTPDPDQLLQAIEGFRSTRGLMEDAIHHQSESLFDKADQALSTAIFSDKEPVGSGVSMIAAEFKDVVDVVSKIAGAYAAKLAIEKVGAPLLSLYRDKSSYDLRTDQSIANELSRVVKTNSMSLSQDTKVAIDLMTQDLAEFGPIAGSNAEYLFNMLKIFERKREFEADKFMDAAVSHFTKQSRKKPNSRESWHFQRHSEDISGDIAFAISMARFTESQRQKSENSGLQGAIAAEWMDQNSWMKSGDFDAIHHLCDLAGESLDSLVLDPSLQNEHAISASALKTYLGAKVDSWLSGNFVVAGQIKVDALSAETFVNSVMPNIHRQLSYAVQQAESSSDYKDVIDELELTMGVSVKDFLVKDRSYLRSNYAKANLEQPLTEVEKLASSSFVKLVTVKAANTTSLGNSLKASIAAASDGISASVKNVSKGLKRENYRP